MINSPAAQLFLAVALIIATAKTTGYFSLRFGQPSMVGALLAGVLLGPSFINLFQTSLFTTDVTPVIGQLAEFGFLLLVFGAGLEIQFEDLHRHGRAIFGSANLGVIVTIILVLPVMLIADYETAQALFVAIALAGTGNGVAAQLAFEMNLIHTLEGVVMLGAAMLDDILVVLCLSLLVAIHINGGGQGEIAEIIFRLVLFLAIAVPLAWWALPRLLNWVSKLPIDAGILATAMCSMLLFSWSAERFGGMTPITGAFLAGLCMARADRAVRKALEEGIFSLSAGFFIPIFLVNIGLRTDIGLLDTSTLPLVLALIVVAILGKIGGSGLGAYWGGLSPRSAYQVGLSMVPRGAVGLAISTIGLDNNLIPPHLFPELVLVILATTVIAPLLVRGILKNPPRVLEEVSQ